MQLFCLTHAGGTAAFYNQLEPYINESIELIKLEYAGHGSRYKESFYRNFFELAEDMYVHIKNVLDTSQDYALIGYSMGSISLVEILKIIIEKREIALPKYVFLAAHEPIPKKELVRFTENETDEFIKEITISFGGLPEKLISNKSFWRIYLPIYRNDYSIIRKYDFDLDKLKIDIPAVVFYSPTDTKIEDLSLWKNYFVGMVEYIEYDGTHFFIQKHAEEMCDVINEKLQVEER